ncbi:DUF2190 family protein [Mesorhizobium sp. M2A.F.Ca.ET.039.01.1.1]|uniref:DUF2190 family protein n=1 Tax=Mesorhizobium sp. M2A.F.Ca.ET.039.01.1.1 TaxID=2496746 RepID=UPI000FCAAA2A|nr:DUF2190 family protein [Mesorhizobium sp. M2A.F.Ca.ET.039.01.1.1]RWX72584.1 DUF2190 family protein [Mesorhizobium sp. M2A.F.Ca.ET.039.01.1.1]
MKNFIQPGEILTMVAPAGGVTSGDLVIIGSIFGVATTSAAAGAEFELKTGGVSEFPKTAAQAWAAGDPIYFDNVNKVMTSVSAGNTKVGVAVEAAANPSGKGRVRLNGSF